MNFVEEIINFIEDIGIDFSIYQNEIIIPSKSLSILLIPDSSTESRSNKILDSSKFDYHPIYIREYLWISKSSVIKSMIRARLNLAQSIYARDCSVKILGKEIANSFLRKYHLIGEVKAKYYYGLYKKDLLVAAAAFSKARVMNREDGLVESFEWVRYAGIDSMRVVGGMGKILEFFINNVNPQEIMSYADRDWSEGDAYLKLGFRLHSYTKPYKFSYNYANEKITPIKAERLESNLDLLDNSKVISNNGNLKFLLRRF